MKVAARLLVLGLLVLSLAIPPTSESDADVMHKMASLLKPTPSGWDTKSNPCSPQWPGVICSNGRVTSINLQSKSLTGSLPSDLNSLSSLQNLSLQRNQLSGALPTLSSLSNLQTVYLDFNNFTSIPSDVFSGLSSLQSFSINANPQLQPWVIPNDLSMSSSLSKFTASNAGVSGSIPAFFGQLPSLQALSLSYNNLSGGIPSSFAGSGLQILWLNNQNSPGLLSGPITVLGSMTQLSQVWLQGNSFTGPIPDLSKCTSLFDLQLRDNQLAGVMPNSIFTLPKLANVSFGNNMFQGPYPSFPSSVTLLDLPTSKNNFCNSKPGPCDPRVTILLEVEEAFGYPVKLADAWTGNDPCNGWLYVWCQNSRVDTINLSSLHFGGTISPAIANLTSLRVLILSGNNLTGSIPKSLTGLLQLKTLDVSDTNLTGGVPPFPSTVKVITTGNLFIGTPSPEGGDGGSGSGSGASGDSPSSGSSKNSKAWIIIVVVVGLLLALATVFIFRSKSRYSTSNQVENANLTVAATSSNGGTTSGQTGLGNSGQSDTQVAATSSNGRTTSGQTGLGNSGLSDNQVAATGSNGGTAGGQNSLGSSGQSDTQVAATSSNVRTTSGQTSLGNKGHSDTQVFESGRSNFFTAQTSPDDNRQSDTQVFGSGSLYFSSAQTGLGKSSNSDTQVFEPGSLIISFHILQQGTNNFNEDNIVGEGGFGVVYKGKLPDGRLIAVKRMESSAGTSQFHTEIDVLRDVSHRHLVSLYGYCTNGNEKFLVYEYMPQGTLGQHLFDWREKNYESLTWKQRLTVALDVARGIEYLHSFARKSFIHRDLKPSNILLGDDMRAKVSDFGLVKLAPEGKSSSNTSQAAGTLGYRAPEYATTGRVTTKIDVYSFGVILMELITGRKVLDESQPEERLHLVPWFRRVLIKGNISKDVDPSLDPDEETFESILKVAELAGCCTAHESHQRPGMGHVVNVLSPLVELWKPRSPREDEGYSNGSNRTLSQVLCGWQSNECTSATSSRREDEGCSNVPPRTLLSALRLGQSNESTSGKGTSMKEGDTYPLLRSLGNIQTSASGVV